MAKIQLHQQEMSELLGIEVYERLREESAFQSSDTELIKAIAIDMAKNPNEWNGLGYLNDFKNADTWDKSLYKILALVN